MRSLKVAAAIVLAVMTAYPATASETVTWRVDKATVSSVISHTLALTVNPTGLDVWVNGVNTATPTFRAGWFIRPTRGLRIGGYVGVVGREKFVNPTAEISGRWLGGAGIVRLEYRQSLTGKPGKLAIPEVRWLWPLGHGVSAGIDGHLSWVEGHRPDWHLGPGLAFKSGNWCLLTRYCPIGGAGETFRLQTMLQF